MASGNEPLRLGRYVLYDEIASGGMASVHLGRLAGSAGFARTVAIKRLHPHCAKDAEFVSMFIDEARLAARIKHPNVVPTLDVVRDGDELFIVMEYISGESLSRLLITARKRGSEISLRLITPVMAQALHGLHAAHTATDEQGKLLGIVHRDVSPQNIIVSTAGIAHVLDFGVAKARGRLQTTREGQIKGKLAYMPPEQLRGDDVTATSDIYAAGVVLWEALAGRRLFRGENEGAIVTAVLQGTTIAPSHHRSNVTTDLDAITMKALHLDPAQRFQNARQMAAALENAIRGAGATEIGEWVQEEASQSLLHRAARVSHIESGSDSGPTSGPSPFDHSWTGPQQGTAAQQAELAITRLATDPNAQENTNIAVTQRAANGKLAGRTFHPLHAAALAVVVLLVGIAAGIGWNATAPQPGAIGGDPPGPTPSNPGTDPTTSPTADKSAEADDPTLPVSTANAATTTSGTLRQPVRHAPRRRRKQPPAPTKATATSQPPPPRKPRCETITVFDKKLGIKIPKKICK